MKHQKHLTLNLISMILPKNFFLHKKNSRIDLFFRSDFDLSNSSEMKANWQNEVKHGLEKPVIIF